MKNINLRVIKAVASPSFASLYKETDLPGINEYHTSKKQPLSLWQILSHIQWKVREEERSLPAIHSPAPSSNRYRSPLHHRRSVPAQDGWVTCYLLTVSRVTTTRARFFYLHTFNKVVHTQICRRSAVLNPSYRHTGARPFYQLSPLQWLGCLY